MKNKKAAMEMSVGTIVTIVLLMSVLVLGIFLVQKIFSSSRSAIDLTDQQLQSEIQKLFSNEDTKLVIYPTSESITLKPGKDGQIGLGIRNIADNVNAGTSFFYKVDPQESDCGITPGQLESWIRLGKSRSGIPVPIGEMEMSRITFKIPEGTPKCLAEFRIEVNRGSEIYRYKTIQVKVK